jgi:hypothetical protein
VWESSRPDIVTVIPHTDGRSARILSGRSNGIAMVRCVLADGSEEGIVTITVEADEPESLNIGVGETT